MTMSAISSTAGTVAKNNYKFNAGTELTESFDINYYETYFRQYDAQLGRFTGVDALAEQTFSWSPYQFGYNNPAMFNDPTGLQADVNPIRDIFIALRDWILSGHSINEISFNGQQVDFVSFTQTIDGDLIEIGGHIGNKERGTFNGKSGYFFSYSYSVNDGGYTEGSDDYTDPGHSYVLNTLGVGRLFAADLTQMFDATIAETESMFSGLKDVFGMNVVGKVSFFFAYMNDNGPGDLKKHGYSYNEVRYSIYRGQPMLFDDYGNYNYGAAANAFGIPLWMALYGAGANQVWNGKADWTNPFGFYDAKHDTEMINKGFNNKN